MPIPPLGTPDRVRPVPTRAQIADAARGSRRELAVAAIVLRVDRARRRHRLGRGHLAAAAGRRPHVDAAVALLRGEKRSVRIQVVGVILVATCVEYTASPFLGYYTYRLHNVPSYVPCHGLFPRSRSAARRLRILLRRPFIAFTLVVCGAWALWGVLLSPRPDAFGAIMYLFLLRFTLRGSRPLVYAGAFLVTSYLELIGTGVGGVGVGPPRPDRDPHDRQPAQRHPGADTASSTPQGLRWGRASGRSSSAGR